MPENTDTERWDWLKAHEKNGPEIYVGGDLSGNSYWFAVLVGGEDGDDIVGRGSCPRQAIDAAMKAEEEAADAQQD